MMYVEVVKMAIISAIIKMGIKSFESQLYVEFEKEIKGKGLTKIENLKVLRDLIEIQLIKIDERIDYHLKKTKKSDIKLIK